MKKLRTEHFYLQRLIVLDIKETMDTCCAFVILNLIEAEYML